MEADYHRHDMSNEVWELITPYLPGQRGQWGGIAEDNRRFINGVRWILRTGAPWRDLPPDYGKWKTVHTRFLRWRDNGFWEELLYIIISIGCKEFEWLFPDGTHIKVHPHGTGAVGGNQDMSRSKVLTRLNHARRPMGGSLPRYIWPWLRMVCRLDSLSQLVPLMIARRQSNC
jgi:transposase